MQSVQKSPRLVDEAQCREALLRGRELIAIRDAGGIVTHYRFLGTPACVSTDTFDRLAAAGLIEEAVSGDTWAIVRNA